MDFVNSLPEGIDTLNEFEDMREWLKDGFLKGFGIGENEPWTTFSEQGYN